MKKCDVIPYEGDKPYIFISYSHKNEDEVLPVIGRMQNEGYRLWYDSGIEAGADWPEVIADHLAESSVFLAFLSTDAVGSHNCRKEFNFAMMENKPSLTVILEPIQLAPVMKMQLSSIQAIYRHECGDDQEFYSKLLSAPVLETCKEETVIVKAKKRVNYFYLERKANGERILVSYSGFKIGRKQEMCDYVISGNPAVSRLHAMLYLQENACYIEDKHSTNGVCVNNAAIPADRPYLLGESDEIDIGGEIFFVRVDEVEVDE